MSTGSRISLATGCEGTLGKRRIDAFKAVAAGVRP